MDIIRKIKPLKATFETLSHKYRLGLLAVLVSLSTFIFPHKTFAQDLNTASSNILVFELGNYQVYLEQKSLELTLQYQQELRRQAQQRQVILALRLKNYLNDLNSPLADYAPLIITQRNWMKLMSLASAESSFCRKYPPSTANCWGIGGTTLWRFGDNLGEGIVAANRFLNSYPLRSTRKYAQMSVEQMNGLYKQPPTQNWVDNNKTVLAALESLIKDL